jgi:hypothetical protein
MKLSQTLKRGGNSKIRRKIIMCKLESIKWAIVKSNKKISKTLTAKLSKIRFGSAQENTFSFYYFNDDDFKNIIQILKSYKNQKFEIVKFFDKQFGLTVNSWIGFSPEFAEKVEELPLSNIFSWFDNNSKRISITPITKKQFDNIIKIN